MHFLKFSTEKMRWIQKPSHTQDGALCVCLRCSELLDPPLTHMHNEMRAYTSLSYIAYNRNKYTKLNPDLQHPIPKNFQTYPGKLI